MNKLIIATDLSEQREQLFNYALKLAEKMNAEVELMTIINKNIEYMPADISMNFVDQWEARQYVANKMLMQVKEQHPEVKSEVVVFIGDPKEDIIHHAIESKATMIILGTHGRTGMSHTLIGSTAEYVVRHSPIPVLVVPMKNYVH